jgi:hypothetical protein
MKKPEFNIGDLVTFKHGKFGFGRIDSVSEKRGSPNEYFYHVLLLSHPTLIGAFADHLEKIEDKEDKDLINALDSVGHI